MLLARAILPCYFFILKLKANASFFTPLGSVTVTLPSLSDVAFLRMIYLCLGNAKFRCLIIFSLGIVLSATINSGCFLRALSTISSSLMSC